MKLPKTLLAAIMVGIAVQTVSSCSKDKTPEPKKAFKPKYEKYNPPVACPACGMG